MDKEPIPKYVLRVLETIRRNGQTNMFARQRVLELSMFEDEAAAAWISLNKDRYGEALEAMGEKDGSKLA